MTKSIIVPLDGSPLGANALPVAVSLARQVGAEIHLIHVHRQPVLLHGAPAYDLQFDFEMERQMGADLQQTARALRVETGLPITATLFEGSTEETLLERIAAERPWLVVMSSHGYGGLQRMWHGSVVDVLVRHAGVPVLVAPDLGDARPTPRAVTEPAFRNILLPLDGSALAEEIVEFVTELGEPVRTTFTLLRVIVPTPMFAPPTPTPSLIVVDERDIKRLARKALAHFERTAAALKQHGFRAVPEIVVHSQPAAAILRFADEHPTDLIALSTHGHGGFVRAILGSVADKVMREADVPVLLHASVRDEL